MSMALALTPPMGWNSWNMFGAEISAELLLQVIDAFKTKELQSAGYQYIVLDDHWQGGRGEDGKLFPDPRKFPQGLQAVAEMVHGAGLKFGLYSDAGVKTCGGRPGSQDFEELDAQTFAAWGVDYLKYDWCYAEDTQANAEYRYKRMAQALRATGRDIVFSLCEWGHHRPWLWAKDSGGQLWRTTGDIGDSWCDAHREEGILGIETIGFVLQQGLEQYAGPGHWNDPDMLVVGLRGKSREIQGCGCTDEEYRTHFSLWCMLAAPLVLGCDVVHMDETTKLIVTNPELIAIDQDPLGSQGFRVARRNQTEVWKKPLADGGLAVGLFNRGARRQVIRTHWSNLGIEGTYRLRDLWARRDLGSFDKEYSAAVAPHGCAILRLEAEQ